jgi:DNA-binding response OmpR family regulator
VVEDDIALCKLNALVLARAGYQVDTAADGLAGWKALHMKSYDLLITDNDMPRLSGLELVKKLRSTQLTLPVVFASGSLDPEELKQDQSLQIAAALPKPYTPSQLLEVVKRILCATGSART